MPALLFLLHGPGGGAVLSAGTDLVSLSAAVLLQWPRLAGPKAQSQAHRGYPRGQRLRTHRELAGRAEARRLLQARAAAPGARSLCAPVLPGREELWPAISLEHHAGRVLHGPGLPLARGARPPVRAALSRVGAGSQS